MANGVEVKKLILFPALVTLAITLLRLVGELNHWSPRLFNSAAGGGGALVGISWLVPIFGIYFGFRLATSAAGPSSVGSALGFAVLGVALLPAVGFTAIKLGMPPQSLATLAMFCVLSIVGAAVAYRGWPALGRTLLAYGLAARIPVIIVMLIAMLGNWGTHYDVAPPNFPEMGPIGKWVLIGLLPQLTVWMWFTIAVGALFGAVAAGAAARARRSATA
jgi:hypothetical protein